MHIVNEDPDDDIILETVIIGKADFIITDEHLLNLGKVEDIPIMKVSDFSWKTVL